MADAASRIQPDTKPDVISYSCTSGSIVIGEERIYEEIRKGAPWAKPMCLVTGVIDALRELDARSWSSAHRISTRSTRRKPSFSWPRGSTFWTFRA
jgi:maleate cis-trans isomerase